MEVETMLDLLRRLTLKRQEFLQQVLLLEQQELKFYQAKMQRKYTQIAQQQFLELKKA